VRRGTSSRDTRQGIAACLTDVVPLEAARWLAVATCLQPELPCDDRIQGAMARNAKAPRIGPLRRV
jgi:hypothetical protein